MCRWCLTWYISDPVQYQERWWWFGCTLRACDREILGQLVFWSMHIASENSLGKFLILLIKYSQTSVQIFSRAWFALGHLRWLRPPRGSTTDYWESVSAELIECFICTVPSLAAPRVINPRKKVYPHIWHATLAICVSMVQRHERKKDEQNDALIHGALPSSEETHWGALSSIILFCLSNRVNQLINSHHYRLWLV